MSGPDLLFPVRNNFYLGAFQTAINEASDLEMLSDLEQIERDSFVYRSYIELGSHDIVINEIPDSAPMALQAVKLLAQYLSGKLSKEEVLGTLADWLADPACSNNPTVLIVGGTIYTHEENYVEALKCCYRGLNLEMMALCVQVYLKMNRPDQADKQVKAMSAVDDDATLTQLSQAWTGLALGGEKVQEAFYIFQELGEKYSWTVRLFNASAVCNLKMGKVEDAEKELLEAFEKNPKDPDTLANLVVVGTHLGKNVARYQSQLKVVAPTHSFIKVTEKLESEFDVAATEFAVAA